MTEIIDDDLGPAGRSERDERRGVARIEAFSDGVFAIAITLLVLNIEIPTGDLSEAALRSALDGLGTDIIGFVIGFFVVGLFWVQHHAFFGDVERDNGRLVWGNLLLLLLIAAMPFSTGLLGDYGSSQIATIIFAVNVLLAWCANYLLDWIGIHDGLLNPESQLVKDGLVRLWAFATPLAFGLSIVVSTFSVEAAQYCWLIAILGARDRHRPAQAGQRP